MAVPATVMRLLGEMLKPCDIVRECLRVDTGDTGHQHLGGQRGSQSALGLYRLGSSSRNSGHDGRHHDNQKSGCQQRLQQRQASSAA